MSPEEMPINTVRAALKSCCRNSGAIVSSTLTALLTSALLHLSVLPVVCEAKSIQENRLGHINIRYPLGIPLGPGREYLLRNIIRTLDDGCIVCQDNVKREAEAHIMIGNKASLLRAAREAALDAKKQLGGRKPQFILVLESYMRYQLLGKALREELKIVKNILGSDVPIFGMFSNKEIVSSKSKETEAVQTELQNGNILIIAVS